MYDFQEEGVQAVVQGLLASTYPDSDKAGHGFLLYDEMGLGKTIQTWESLKRMKEQGKLPGPTLVVAPSASVIPIWIEGDYLKYYADVFRVHEGLQDPTEMTNADVVVVSYTMLLNAYKYYVYKQIDLGFVGVEELRRFCRLHNKSMNRTLGLTGDDLKRELLCIARTVERKRYDTFQRHSIPFWTKHWGCIVMDEIHKVRNPKSSHSKSVGFLHGHYRLGLSGRPIMNHAGDLMAILQYGLGLWHTDFTQINNDPNGPYCTKILKAFTLGRTKDELDEMRPLLPKRNKDEELVMLEWDYLPHKQVYVSTKMTSLQTLHDSVTKIQGESFDDFRQRRKQLTLNFLHQIQRLRQVCLHPDLPGFMPTYEAPPSVLVPFKVAYDWRPAFHGCFHPWIRQRTKTLLLSLLRALPMLYECQHIRLTLVKHFCEREHFDKLCIQPSPKMRQVLPFLQTHRKIIVFCSFKVFLTHIMKPWLDGMGVASEIFCGDGKARQQAVLKSFRDNPETRVLLLVKASGAESLNLQESCNVCIIMDPHFNDALGTPNLFFCLFLWNLKSD